MRGKMKNGRMVHMSWIRYPGFPLAQKCEILLYDKIISSFVVSSCGTVESTDCNEDNNTKSRLPSEVIVVQIEVHCLK